MRTPSSSKNAVARTTPSPRSHDAIARAVSGVSAHGHHLAAHAGSANSITPTGRVTSACTTRSERYQPGSGAPRGGSAPLHPQLKPQGHGHQHGIDRVDQEPQP